MAIAAESVCAANEDMMGGLVEQGAVQTVIETNNVSRKVVVKLQ